MGWRELRAWLAVMGRQHQVGRPDPHKWSQASRENFAELDAKRRQMRGR